MKNRIKDFIPVAVGLFTLWITNGQVDAFYGKLQEVCYKTDPTNVYGDCSFDTTLLFLTCLLASVGAAMLAHYLLVKEHH